MYLLYFLASFIVSALFVIVRQRYSYWKRKSIPQLEPVFPLGNLNGLKHFHMQEKFNEIYTKVKGKSPIAGIYLFAKPAAVALDLELIKSILIKDFNLFTDRMQFVNTKHDPLSKHLFHMEGNEWKRMRTKLSPTFTSGKMKFMFPTVVGVAKEFEEAMRLEVEKTEVIEVRELLARYTTDVIGTCVFGLQCNSLKDPDAEFCAYGRRFMETPHHSTLLRHFLLTYNKFCQKLGFVGHDPAGIDFFMKVIRDTLALREANNIQRRDFMNLLIELKNQKEADGSDGLTFEEVAAQAYVFFVAGFETSASNMSFTLFELARNPSVQDRLRQEIITVLGKHNNQLTYEAMSDMTYLSQCIQETLRMYPALVSLTRIASENYPIPGTKFLIEKGTPIFIPVWSIHYDPDIYSNPHKYDPDRFSPENVQTRDAMAFLGFGDGPRNCIGLRFARMQVRIGLITLLKSFKFSVSEKTPSEIPLNARSFVLLPEHGVCLKVEAV